MTEIGSKLPSGPSTTAAMPIQVQMKIFGLCLANISARFRELNYLPRLQQEARQNAIMESVPSEENDAGGSLGEHQEAIRLLQHLRDRFPALSL